MRQLLLGDEGCAAFVGRVSIGPWSASKASRHRGPEGEMIRGQNRLAQCDCSGSGQRTMRTSPVCHDVFPRVEKRAIYTLRKQSKHLKICFNNKYAYICTACSGVHK